MRASVRLTLEPIACKIDLVAKRAVGIDALARHQIVAELFDNEPRTVAQALLFKKIDDEHNASAFAQLKLMRRQLGRFNAGHALGSRSNGDLAVFVVLIKRRVGCCVNARLALKAAHNLFINRSTNGVCCREHSDRRKVFGHLELSVREERVDERVFVSAHVKSGMKAGMVQKTIARNIFALAIANFFKPNAKRVLIGVCTAILCECEPHNLILLAKKRSGKVCAGAVVRHDR